MLEKIKIRLGIEDNSKDLLVLELIQDATNEILDYINMKTIPENNLGIVKDLVIFKYNRIESEGILSESYSGVSQSFVDGYPKELKDRLRRIRKLAR